MSGVPYVFGNATTSIPLSQLDVNFATNATIGTTSVGLGNTTTTLVGLTNVSTTVVNTSNVSANTSLLLQTNGTTTAVTIDTNQNVGVGVTPSAWSSNYKGLQMNGGALQVYTSGDRFAVNQNAFVNSGGVSSYVNNGYASQYLQLNSEHRFYTAPSGTAGNAITFTQAMTLTNAGSLQINTTSAVYSSVERVSILSSGTDGGIGIQTSTGIGVGINLQNGVSGNTFISFGVGGSGKGSITWNGTLTVYNTTSDRRLKSNIVDLTTSDSGVLIDSLLPRKFTWTDSNTSDVGFIADEVQNILPSAVTGTANEVDENGKPVYQMVDMSIPEIIAHLVAEIKSLRQRMAQSEAQVTTLQTQINGASA